MGDQFEKFVKENRDGFDNETINSPIWDRISGELDADEKSKPNWTVYWKVAAVVLLACTVWLGVDKLSQEDTQSDYISEFAQAEAFYTSMIEQTQSEIAELVTEDLKYDFQNEISELDLMYDELRTQMGEMDQNEQLTAMMIENLQMQIEILNQQLNILKKINQTNDDNEQNETYEI